MPWTEKMDEEMIRLSKMRLTRIEIAQHMGVSKNSVASRARRIGLRFYKQKQESCAGYRGHLAADPRSAELLRQAGVQI